MKKIVTLILMLVVSLLGLCVSAQAETLPYQVNFEANETAEIAQWVLNPGGTTDDYLDKWVVGNSVHSTGRQALYISNNGHDAMFDSLPCVQYAYRDVVLPAGQCVLSFDWMCIGGDVSSLYVGISSSLTSVTLVANNTGNLPALPTNPVLSRMSAFKNLKGQDRWKNESYPFSTNGSTIRLVFAWVSKNTDPDACTMGACIDNIVITNANCPRPTNITTEMISCDSARVSWTGNSYKYEVNYRQVGTTNWISESRFTTDPNDYTKSSAIITNLTEGNFEIRVRGICPPDTSAWMYAEEMVIFCPDLHCVNFTDLYAPTVTCTYGNTNDAGYSSTGYIYPASRNQAYAHEGVIDYGSESILSRHTVNWDKTATDPRTGNNLPLIPKGGYASVRLGNWEDGYGAEAITYEYVVDSSNAVVLMQYAVVLQDPDGHGEDAPRFLLEILDENNNLIEPTCGVRNFVTSSVNRNEWQTYTPTEDNYYNEPVLYKPWATVGLNLKELGIQDGQTIRVRLTTFDCFWSAHYGYAYFTLDCAKATIESASCAKDAGATMTLIAPDGFKYQWYDKNGNAIRNATSRVFEPSDTATYRCRLTSTENNDCYFDLYSACVPRLPAPEFTMTNTVENCLNVVDITNHSHTLIIQKHDTIVSRNEMCNEHVWNISGTLTDGSPYGPFQNGALHPQLILPAEGGHFRVELTASLVGGCDSTIVQEFDLPDVRYAPTVLERTLCRPVNEPTAQAWLDELEMWIPESGQYSKTFTAANGCDSVVTYNVQLGNTYNIHLGDTTLCYGEILQVGNILYDSRTRVSGKWADYTLKTDLGCDSFVYYNVTVTAPIEPVITCNGEDLDLPDGRVDVFGDDVTVDLEIGGTGYDGYTMTYTDPTGQQHIEQHTTADTRLEGLAVNEYKFVFFNNNGCEYNASVLVGGDTLCLNLLSQIECACGEAVLHIPYRKCEPANKARISTCSVFFSETDKAEQGFEDALFTGLHAEDTIRIAVPAGAEPGLYAVDLVFDTIIGGCIWGQNAFHTNILLTYDSSVIFHRWNENAIISLAGPTAAKKHDGSDYELYAFSDFQWLRNGEEVEHENRSYMEQPGVLNLEDAFALRMKRADGQVFTTCPYIPGHNRNANYAAPKASIVVSPSDPLAGSSVEVTLTDDAEIELYSIMGTKVMNRQFTKGISTFTTPSAQGVYILKAYMRGEAQTLMLRVR